MNETFKIGLTGGIASGKTTVCDLFKELSVEIIDADVISHELSKKGGDAFEEIIEAFEDEGLREEVNIMVGGLPVQPTNILKYGCNWSLEGLLNEYKEDCVVLKDGLITLERGLDGVVTVQTSLGELEAFYTSGGISHTIDSMYDKGVQNCSYKTLRYPGHNIIIKFLVRESGLTDQQIRDVLKASCPRTEDLVIISVKVDNKSHEEVIMSSDRFSAMQRATTFAATAAVTSVIVNDMSGQLKYSDIKYHKFCDHLNYLLRK